MGCLRGINLADHYSAGRDRRYRDRIHRLQDQGVALSRQARRTAQRAAHAAGHTDHRHTPETVANRIRELAAGRRRVDREMGRRRAQVPDHDHGHDGRLVELAEQAALDEQLRYWTGVRTRQVADGTATGYGWDDIAVGDLVRRRGIWLPVVRVNTVTVSVPSPIGTWTTTVRYEHLDGHARPGDPHSPAERLGEPLPLNPPQARSPASRGRTGGRSRCGSAGRVW